MPILNRHSRQFVDMMRRNLSGLQIDISDDIAIFNLKSLLETMFGEDNVPEPLVKQYHEDNTK